MEENNKTKRSEEEEVEPRPGRAQKKARLEQDELTGDYVEEAEECLLGQWFGSLAEVPQFFSTSDGLAMTQLQRGSPSDVGEIVQDHSRRYAPFTRHISTFCNGETLSKHCLPYGPGNLLLMRSFTLRQKFFRIDGQLSAVLVRHDAEKRDLLLSDQVYFTGWMNDVCRAEFAKFTANK